jgi:hypothetical protein
LSSLRFVVIERYTKVQRVRVVKTHYKHGESFAETVRKVRGIFDEAHFQLDGYMNTENCRIWGAENPRVIHEKPLHAQRATVWCGFLAGGVIGP